jgi:phosphatidylglycerophosphate synthase
VRTVQTGPVAGLIGQMVLLAALAVSVGVTAFGWVLGIACAVFTSEALGRGLDRYGADRLGPADWVTLVRATLVGGVAALTVEPPGRSAPVPTLVALTVVALALDAVDGWVARRTGTASALGAHFDQEVDAFLILVLSVYVARSTGAWVLAIGLARYAFMAAGRLLPLLRRPLPPRYWGKVVAAIQGIALTVAVAGVLPRPATVGVLAVALALLTESFGHSVWWLWRHRRLGDQELGVHGFRVLARPHRRRTDGGLMAGVVTAAAALLVWLALLVPDDIGQLSLGAFLRIPLEGLLVVALLLLLPPRLRRPTAALLGLALGLLAFVKFLDLAFLVALGRPFNPVTDWSYFGSAVSLLGDSIGRRGALLALVAAGLLAVAVLVLIPLSVLRLLRLVGANRATSLRVVAALAVLWVGCAVVGVQVVPGLPVASSSAAGLAYTEVSRVRGDLVDERAFAQASAADPLAGTPGRDLLTGLRGKDVLVVFVESYGRVAVQGSPFARGVDATLDAGTRRLHTAGFSSRSAFLTSPTFGGISWLAHSTLQSGLWIDNQQRYDALMASSRSTLADAFKRAGWRTVADVPSDDRDWPQGSTFYHYDKVYDSRDVGYAGPKFSYATMPDQYTLLAFRRAELAARNRAPVMAEIDLLSSHTPWAPLPHLVEWSKVGDGSVFDPMPAQGPPAELVWREPSRVRTAYGQSVQYTLRTLISFLSTFHDKNLVVIALGDHQPATIVSGTHASHDVPVTIIAHDPAVMQRISGWDWQQGLRPGPDAPVWRMDTFRDRFLAAYGRHPAPGTPVAVNQTGSGAVSTPRTQPQDGPSGG